MMITATRLPVNVEALSVGADHGCLTGDCPHEVSGYCFDRIKEHIGELANVGLQLAKMLPATADGYPFTVGMTLYDPNGVRYIVDEVIAVSCRRSQDDNASYDYPEFGTPERPGWRIYGRRVDGGPGHRFAWWKCYSDPENVP